MGYLKGYNIVYLSILEKYNPFPHPYIHDNNISHTLKTYTILLKCKDISFKLVYFTNIVLIGLQIIIRLLILILEAKYHDMSMLWFH